MTRKGSPPGRRDRGGSFVRLAVRPATGAGAARSSRGCEAARAGCERSLAAAGAGAPVEQVAELLGPHRVGEQEALAEVAVLALELLELGGQLDPLTEGLQAERLAELDEGSDERGGFAGVVDPADERLVDLQRVDRELAQVAE